MYSELFIHMGHGMKGLLTSCTLVPLALVKPFLRSLVLGRVIGFPSNWRFDAPTSNGWRKDACVTHKSARVRRYSCVMPYKRLHQKEMYYDKKKIRVIRVVRYLGIQTFLINCIV